MLNIGQTFFGRRSVSWVYRCARPSGAGSCRPDHDDRGERAGGPGGRFAAGRGQAGPGRRGVLRGEGPAGAGGALPGVPRRGEVQGRPAARRARSMLKGGDGGPAVVPGKPEESALVEAIRYDGDVQMPPKGKLKDAEIAALTDWVKRGRTGPRPARGSRTDGRRAPDRSAAAGSRRLDRVRRRRSRPDRSGRSGRSATPSRRRCATRPGRPRRSTGSSSPASRPTACRRRRRPTRRP